MGRAYRNNDRIARGSGRLLADAVVERAVPVAPDMEEMPGAECADRGAAAVDSGAPGAGVLGAGGVGGFARAGVRDAGVRDEGGGAEHFLRVSPSDGGGGGGAAGTAATDAGDGTDGADYGEGGEGAGGAEVSIAGGERGFRGVVCGEDAGDDRAGGGGCATGDGAGECAGGTGAGAAGDRRSGAAEHGDQPIGECECADGAGGCGAGEGGGKRQWAIVKGDYECGG